MSETGDQSNTRSLPNRRYPDERSRSAELYNRARRVLPSGNSRHTIFFKPYPIYAREGSGCRIVDEDGVERIDFINNFTSLIHGHQPPAVMTAINDQLGRIMAVGLPTESEIILAELLVERLAGVEQIRFMNSGTEAVMMAIKAARAHTGRPKIAKAEGAYHGAYDYAEISQVSTGENWGDEKRPLSVSAYPGQPKTVADDVVVLPWNDIEASRAILEEHADSLAAVLVDPLPSRLAYAAIEPGYLRMIEEFCRRSGALLVADEVYSLRLGYNGAQGKFGFRPDLTALGKIIGGGFPIGAVGGRADVMAVFGLDHGRPKLPHGGTYNANPLSMTAGLATMTLLTPDAFANLETLGKRLRDGLSDCLKVTNRIGQVSGEASLAMLSLSDRKIENHRDLVRAEKFGEAQATVHRELLNRGVLVSPSLGFALSTAINQSHIDFALEQVAAALRAL